MAGTTCCCSVVFASCACSVDTEFECSDNNAIAAIESAAVRQIRLTEFISSGRDVVARSTLKGGSVGKSGYLRVLASG